MLVVEVRQGPLEDEEEGRKEATNIKSNNPHLAGGEKSTPQKNYGKNMLSLCNYAPVLEASMQVSWGSMPWSENCQAAHLIECVFMRGYG